MHTKFEWKKPLKTALTFGLAVELIAIGMGYCLYKEYTTNQSKNSFFFKFQIVLTGPKFTLFTEFRETAEEKFPQLTQLYWTVSGMYLDAMPKKLKDRILDEKTEETSVQAKVDPPAENKTENVQK